VAERTAKNEARQRLATAHDKEYSHGKDAFAVWQPFAVRKQAFSFFFISVLFFLLLMFISQLVLYFVDYLLVLLNTMCIYSAFCNTTYSTSSSPPHIYQGFRANHASGNFSKWYCICVPHDIRRNPSPSRSTPLDLEGVATPEAQCTAKP
jgi:hypothetical protein